MAPAKPRGRGLVKFEDPLEGVPAEERLKILRQIGAEAKAKYEQLIGELEARLRKIEPEHVICSAGYLLVFTGDKPVWADSYSFGQHQAELLQALLLRRPPDFYERVVGTPDQVQSALDLVKDISDARLKIPYADI